MEVEIKLAARDEIGKEDRSIAVTIEDQILDGPPQLFGGASRRDHDRGGTRLPPARHDGKDRARHPAQVSSAEQSTDAGSYHQEFVPDTQSLIEGGEATVRV